MNKESFINEALQHMLHKQTSLVDIINAAIEYGQANANHWISVEDGLPKETNMYLVIHHNVVCTMWWYDNLEEWAEIYVDENENIQSRKMDGITHWQHLPQPPIIGFQPNQRK